MRSPATTSCSMGAARTARGADAAGSVDSARVRTQRRLPAEVRVKHSRVARYLAAGDEVDHASHRLPLVDRVRDHPLEPPGETDRLERRFVRNPIRAAVIAIVEDDLVVTQIASQS